MKVTLLPILFFATLSVILGWALFVSGYYIATIHAERDKIELVRGDIKFLKHVVAELKKDNSAGSLDKLQDMLKFKEFYLKTTYQVTDELTFSSFAFHPLLTTQLIESRSHKAESK